MTRSFYVKFVAVIAALTAMPAFAAFFDSFEGASLNPFWTVSDNRLSTGTLSTTQAHTGTQSFKMQSLPGGQRFFVIDHNFGIKQKGVV